MNLIIDLIINYQVNNNTETCSRLWVRRLRLQPTFSENALQGRGIPIAVENHLVSIVLHSSRNISAKSKLRLKS